MNAQRHTCTVTIVVLIVILSISVLVSCSGTMVNLTPDVIREYGLDRQTLPNVQLYYRAITISVDSTVTHKEPTVFRRIGVADALVSETRSPAEKENLNKSEIFTVKDRTPCRISSVLDSGRTLQADFGNLKLNFKLSYEAGYTFVLSSDTVSYNSDSFVPAQIPLMRSVGILTLQRKELVELTKSKIRIRGKRVDEDL